MSHSRGAHASDFDTSRILQGPKANRNEVQRLDTGMGQAASGGSSFLMPLATTSVRLRAPAPLR